MFHIWDVLQKPLEEDPEIYKTADDFDKDDYIKKDKDNSELEKQSEVDSITTSAIITNISGIDEDIEEGKIKQTFLDLINVGDTVIDVGANIGEYSLIAAHKVKQNGRIIAIEPLKETVHSLTKNFQLNNFTNYEIISKVVGKENKKVNLYKEMAGGTMGFVDSTLNNKKLVRLIGAKINKKQLKSFCKKLKI